MLDYRGGRSKLADLLISSFRKKGSEAVTDNQLTIPPAPHAGPRSRLPTRNTRPGETERGNFGSLQFVEDHKMIIFEGPKIRTFELLKESKVCYLSQLVAESRSLA